MYLKIVIKNANILAHNVLPLHALLAREGPEEDGVVSIGERRVRICRPLDPGEQRARQVLELHHVDNLLPKEGGNLCTPLACHLLRLPLHISALVRQNLTSQVVEALLFVSLAPNLSKLL